jgi:hypothetical protein
MTSLLDNGFSGASTEEFEVVVTDPAPAPKMAAVRDDAARSQRRVGGGSTSIQLGAYRDRNGAHSAAQSAQRRVPSLLSSGRIDVVAVRGKDRKRNTVYMARIGDLSPDAAARACQLLKKPKGVSCSIVGAGPDVAAAPAPRRTGVAGSRTTAAPGSRAGTRAAATAPTRPEPWGVQVGAFATSKSAYTAAKKAKQSASKMLGSGKIAVAPLRNGKKPVYRARVLGIERQEALNACRMLSAKDFDCVVVRM